MVPAATELLLERCQRAAHAFRHRDPNQLETLTLASLLARMREAQKVKRLTLAAILPFASDRAAATKLKQPGLFRMQVQTELSQTLPQCVQTCVGFDFMLKADREIVRVANDDHVALSVLASPLIDPQIKHVMQKHVGSDGGKNGTLWRSLAVVTPIGSFDDPGIEPFENQSNDPLVADTMFDETDQPVTVDVVKAAGGGFMRAAALISLERRRRKPTLNGDAKTFDVGIQYPVHSLFVDPGRQRIKSLMLRTPGTEAVAETDEVLFVDALDNRSHGVLNDFVFQRRNAQGAFPAVRLFDVHPPGGLRSEGSAVNPTMKINDSICKVFLVFIPADTVDSECCFPAKLVKACRQQFGVDVVQQVAEFEIAASLRRLTHTEQPA